MKQTRTVCRVRTKIIKQSTPLGKERMLLHKSRFRLLKKLNALVLQPNANDKAIGKIIQNQSCP